MCNPRPDGWTRELFGGGWKGGAPGNLGHRAESPRLQTGTLAVGRKPGGERRNLAGGLPFELLPQATNVRGGLSGKSLVVVTLIQ